MVHWKWYPNEGTAEGVFYTAVWALGELILWFLFSRKIYHYFLIEILAAMGLPRWCSHKESTCQSRRHERCGFDPCIWKIPCRRTWQPTPVFLPGESQEQRSLVGYSPWNFKELDTTESACMHWFLFFLKICRINKIYLPNTCSPGSSAGHIYLRSTKSY